MLRISGFVVGAAVTTLLLLLCTTSAQRVRLWDLGQTLWGWTEQLPMPGGPEAGDSVAWAPGTAALAMPARPDPPIGPEPRAGGDEPTRTASSRPEPVAAPGPPTGTRKAMETAPGGGVESPTARVPVPAEPTQRHPFWSPFRSELSAQGFAERLQRLSGVQVVVYREAVGRYRVGVEYSNEEALRVALSQIENATGLRIEQP